MQISYRLPILSAHTHVFASVRRDALTVVRLYRPRKAISSYDSSLSANFKYGVGDPESTDILSITIWNYVLKGETTYCGRSAYVIMRAQHA